MISENEYEFLNLENQNMPKKCLKADHIKTFWESSKHQGLREVLKPSRERGKGKL